MVTDSLKYSSCCAVQYTSDVSHFKRERLEVLEVAVYRDLLEADVSAPLRRSVLACYVHCLGPVGVRPLIVHLCARSLL